MQNFMKTLILIISFVFCIIPTVSHAGAGARFVAWTNTIDEFPIGGWSFVWERGFGQSWFDEYAAANLNMLQINALTQLNYTKAAGLNAVVGSWDKWAEDYKTYNQELIDVRTLASDANNHISIFLLKDDLPRYEYTGNPWTNYYDQYDGINHVANYHIYSLPSNVMTEDNFIPCWADVSMYGKTYWTLVDEGLLRCNPTVSAHCNYPILLDGSTASDYGSQLLGWRNRSYDVVGNSGAGVFGIVSLVSYNPGGGYPRPNREATVTDARWQVNMQLAYGAKGIWWYFYQKKPSGMDAFGDGYLDLNDQQTSLYSMCAAINAQTLNWGRTLDGLNSGQTAPLKTIKTTHIKNSGGGMPSGCVEYAYGDASTYFDFQVDSTHTTGGVCVGYFNWPWSSKWIYVMVVNMQHGTGTQSAYTRNITCKFKDTLVSKGYISPTDGNYYDLSLPAPSGGWHTQTYSVLGGDAIFFALQKP